MTKEEKQNGQARAAAEIPAENAAAEAASPKKPLLKYILFGVGGLVLVALIAVGTLLIFGEDAAQPETAELSHNAASSQEEPAAGSETSKTDEHHDVADDAGQTGTASDKTHSDPEAALEMSAEDSIMAMLEEESSVFDEIKNNLEFLDYAPSAAELGSEEESSMSVEDSVEQVNWLEAETTRLAEWEKDLNARQKELDITDNKVSQKLKKLEQAESNKVSNLAKLYDGMDPRSVAQLMANLDDATVVSILPRMKMKNASSVLALMSAVRGARLSKQMITIAEN